MEIYGIFGWICPSKCMKFGLVSYKKTPVINLPRFNPTWKENKNTTFSPKSYIYIFLFSIHLITFFPLRKINTSESSKETKHFFGG